MSPQPEGIRGATISGTGMYVPERVLTNADLEKMVDTTDSWIVERTGIRERRIARDDEPSSEMAVIAVRRALESAKLEPKDIDQIIVVTTTPDRFLPSCACTIQKKIGASNAAAYDVFAACTGFIYGLGLARSLIGSRVAETILVIGVEKLSSIVDYTDRNTCVLFGDGAGAAIVQPAQPGQGILAVSMRSDGELGEVLEIPAGGSARPMDEAAVRAKDNTIHMRGKELFKIAVRTMEESLREALNEAGVGMDELKLVIPHQANQRIIDAMRDRLGVPADKVITNIDRYGNTSSASIPISLDEVVREGRLKPGDHVAFVAFGGGVTWGASVMRWTMPAPLVPVEPATLVSARRS
ncbi:MAG TPA: beta-ketoacyl-ACP synthase III [Candidatus Udaeobacter sp.]|jgi:3-oxoacyl-[acyl-carrier-protein] synthase-3|nr:beta-ketoacyl-ACP synthase III [Candidatus Udaeobacter sp.]